MRKSVRKVVRAAAATACAVVVLGSAGSAYAGEITGSGKPTGARGNAKSLCAFSGLEDFDLEAPVDPGVTQNWGQIIKEAGPLGGAANVEFIQEGCNAKLYPAK